MYSIDTLAVAIFATGAGVSLAQNAFLSAGGVYILEYGANSFLWIAIGVYAPSFPVSGLLALISDLEARQCVGQKLMWCDTRRVCGAFLALGVILLCMPLVKSFQIVFLLSLFTGISSSIAMTYAFQMAIRAGKARQHGVCESALSFGYQASTILCFLALTAARFYPEEEGKQLLSAKTQYFISVGVLQFLVVIPTAYIPLSGVARIPTSPLGDNSSPQGLQNASDPLLPNLDIEGGQLSWRLAIETSWKSSLSLFCTVFSSMVVFPFYSFVPSQSHSAVANAKFGTLLFFVKSFSDSLIRPLTGLFPAMVPQSSSSLLILSILRAVIGAPIFFDYVFGNGSFFPTNDVFFALFIGCFAASSGFLVTSSYISAARLTDSVAFGRRVTTVMNLSFQFAVFTAVATSVFARYVFLS